jgi:hypothetical protein
LASQTFDRDCLIVQQYAFWYNAITCPAKEQIAAAHFAFYSDMASGSGSLGLLGVW